MPATSAVSPRSPGQCQYWLRQIEEESGGFARGSDHPTLLARCFPDLGVTPEALEVEFSLLRGQYGYLRTEEPSLEITVSELAQMFIEEGVFSREANRSADALRDPLRRSRSPTRLFPNPRGPRRRSRGARPRRPGHCRWQPGSRPGGARSRDRRSNTRGVSPVGGSRRPTRSGRWRVMRAVPPTCCAPVTVESRHSDADWCASTLPRLPTPRDFAGGHRVRARGGRRCCRGGRTSWQPLPTGGQSGTSKRARNLRRRLCSVRRL